MKPLLAALAITTLFSFCSSPAHAAAVDPAGSLITWKGSKVTGASHSGLLAVASSSIELTDGVLSPGVIVFDMASLTVTDLDGAMEQKFLGHMKSADFFDVAAHPTATFRVDTFVEGKFSGVLTIKGISRPLSFPAKRKGKAYVGTASFNRTEFDIVYGSGSFFSDLGDKMISDLVEVQFSLALADTAG